MEWMAHLDDGGGSKTAENLAKSNALVLPLSTGDCQPPSDSSAGSSFRDSPSVFANRPTGERHLFNHFLHVVSRALVVVNDDDNPFLRIFVPMAVVHDSVRHAINALSASHLAKAYPDFQLDALQHQSWALRGLKDALGQEKCNIECALAITLILCLLEVNLLNPVYRL